MRIGQVSYNNYSEMSNIFSKANSTMFGSKSSSTNVYDMLTGLKDIVKSDKSKKYIDEMIAEYTAGANSSTEVSESTGTDKTSEASKKPAPGTSSLHTNLTNDMTSKIQDLAKKEFVKNNGQAGDTQAFKNLTKGYINATSVYYKSEVAQTATDAYRNETARLTEWVQKKDPDWKPGQEINEKLFDGYVPGGVELLV